tara:strand:- start:32 stop:280 length:249 start_codon:yes stop_codon:yes gene_type:complete
MRKLKRIVLPILIVLLIAGCQYDSQVPNGINNAPRPLTLLAVGSKGVLIVDADGNLYSYSTGYYFSQTIINSGLKAGDIISN